MTLAFDRVYHQKIMEFLNYTETDKKDYSKPVLGAESSGVSPEWEL